MSTLFTTTPLMKKLRKWEYWVVGILIVVALGLRLFNLAELMTFSYDQGRDMYVLQDILQGNFTLVGPTTGLAGLFVGPFMYYFLAPGFALSGGSPVGVTQWQMLWIVLSYPLLYLLLKPLVGRSLALVGLLLLVVTPGAIEQSRVIWNPSLVVPTMLVMTWAFFASQKKPWLLLVGSFFYGLLLQTELAYAVFLAPLMAWWVLSGWYKKIYDWKIVILAGVAFGLTLLPQGLFELRNQFIMTKSLSAEMADESKKVPLAQVFAERPKLIISELERTLFAGQTGSKIFHLAVVILLFTLLIRRQKSREEWFALGLVFVPLIGMMLHRGNHGFFFNYYITAHYLPIIIALMMAIYRWLRYREFISFVVVLMWLIGFMQFASFIYDTSIFKYTMALQLEALNYARDIHTQEPYAIEPMVPNLQPVNYRYLNDWLNKTRTDTQADFFADGIHREFFLVYEPADSSHEFTFDPWMKRWLEAATCSDKREFGIVTVERCVRKE